MSTQTHRHVHTVCSSVCLYLSAGLPVSQSVYMNGCLQRYIASCLHACLAAAIPPSHGVPNLVSSCLVVRQHSFCGRYDSLSMCVCVCTCACICACVLLSLCPTFPNFVQFRPISANGRNWPKFDKLPLRDRYASPWRCIFTPHCSPCTVHCSLFTCTVHCSLFTVHGSLYREYNTSAHLIIDS